MGNYEIVEHTADVGVVATGQTLGEALSFVAMGMFSIIVDPGGVEATRRVRVSLSSTDAHALVVDWLNELLYRFEADGFVPKECRVEVDDRGTALQADCWGDDYDPERHRLGTEVKAATYHRLDICHNDQWQVRVVLDV